MRPFRLSMICSVLLLAGASQAQAAWDNVYQVTCFGCWKKPAPAPAPAYYYQPPPSPCNTCQPACSTTYQLRSYYQPVTTYRTSYYLEPVTTVKTSYYYEPVVSYRYASYYDPSSCGCQQRAVPVTTYQLKAQSCPVTSYLQRCQVVPETTQKLAYYYEPVTRCCQTTVGAPIYPNGSGAPGGVQESQPIPSAPGGVQESSIRQTNPPTSLRTGANDDSSRFTPQPADYGSYRQPSLQPPIPVQQAPKQTEPPAVRIDRIVMLDTKPNVEGQVVVNDINPQAGAKVLFVSSDQLGAKETVTADAKGQFKATLASGGWLVYVHDENGKPVFKEKVEVKANEPQRMLLTSR